MKAVETNTLKVFTEGFTQEDMQLRDKYLIMMHILSTMQMTVCKELEDLLNKQGKFRHEIKHNHKQIDNLVKKNYRNMCDNGVRCERSASKQIQKHTKDLRLKV